MRKKAQTCLTKLTVDLPPGAVFRFAPLVFSVFAAAATAASVSKPAPAICQHGGPSRDRTAHAQVGGVEHRCVRASARQISTRWQVLKTTMQVLLVPNRHWPLLAHHPCFAVSPAQTTQAQKAQNIHKMRATRKKRKTRIFANSEVSGGCASLAFCAKCAKCE